MTIDGSRRVAYHFARIGGSRVRLQRTAHQRRQDRFGRLASRVKPGRGRRVAGPMRNIVNRAVGAALIGVILSGCAGITSRPELIARHLGIRPDEPTPGTNVKGGPANDVCDEYKAYVVYAQQLEESYYSRATQNRWWIYFAGILGLGTIAATGGLAAASAAKAGT